MARKFLYVMAGLALIVIVSGFALNIWSRELTQLALVPSTEFVEQNPLADNAYQAPDMWFSRPGMGTGDPARWQPAVRGDGRSLPAPADQTPPDFAVFFVHPTSYMESSNWNAPLDNAEANDRARLFIRGLASPFNQASEIWAPRYRQATVGAFLTDSEDAQGALDAAYADVAQAFAFFRDTVDADTPIVIAGHSQGALHLLRLMREEVAGQPVADRIVAAYVIGWPISVERDLPALPFPACATINQSGCILSWSSYAEPAEPDDLLEAYSTSIGFNGQPRGDSAILCTNPLTGGIGGSSAAAANLGTLVPEDSLENGELVSSYVPARCDNRGLLLIGPPPEMGSFVLPGNNYHVYDIPLFWRNVQQDVAMRVDAWAQAYPQ